MPIVPIVVPSNVNFEAVDIATGMSRCRLANRDFVCGQCKDDFKVAASARSD
jgi:hypothetical protein